MRRVLTILSAIVLLVVSLGIGVFTADLPFWRRALQLPLPADDIYLPVAGIGTEGPADPGTPGGLDATLADECASRASALGSRALLVMHHGQLVLERYFVADDAHTLLPATVVARPLAAMAVGLALGEQRAGSLDAPVSTWLQEWKEDPRGRITLRQLLEETSGLETGGRWQGLLRSAPFEDTATLPRFATSRGVRMILGNDYESSALGFRLDHEPGGFHNVSPANTQLAAVIVERVSGQPYERFIEQHLWTPADAGNAQMQLDRRAGMPAAHCCWRATARGMLKIAHLLSTDGRSQGRQLLPAGWVREMSRPSRVSAGTGLQVNLLRIENEDVLEVTDEEGSAFWAFPARELTVLSIGAHSGGDLRELPILLSRGLAVLQ
jgi:CubicO group peptidase (beta-lactamase class C family)